MTPERLLVDADILAYVNTTVVEQTVDWGDDVWTLWADFKDAQYLVDETIAELEEATGVATQDWVLCFSSPNNFRFDVTPTYKSGRKETRKPLCYKRMVEYLESRFDVQRFPRLEGDDVIGLLMDRRSAIWSTDKDLKQIPGLHWDGTEFYEISEDDAERFFFYQVLAGDPTDGYAGCPGVGPVRAERILDKDCSWEAVVAAYEKQGLTEEDALIVARQARIIRPGEYDFEKQEPILWTP